MSNLNKTSKSNCFKKKHASLSKKKGRRCAWQESFLSISQILAIKSNVLACGLTENNGNAYHSH